MQHCELRKAPAGWCAERRKVSAAEPRGRMYSVESQSELIVARGVPSLCACVSVKRMRGRRRCMLDE